LFKLKKNEMKQYYYVTDDGSQAGPFLKEALKIKGIKPDTMVWYEGIDQWTRAAECEDLTSIFVAAPPPITYNKTVAPPPVNKELKTVPPPVVPTVKDAVQANKVTPINTIKKGNQRTKVVAGIFGILLGGIGVHKFYIGSWGWGIVYVLLCWTIFPSVVGLIEGIMYMVMNDDEFNKKYNETPDATFKW